jgi:anaerobic dimethyl sulfoxide reductase subunit C (anchor subunit)
MNIREWTLPVYTIMIQLATGCLFALWVIRALASSMFGKEEMDRVIKNPLLIVFSTIVAAMIGSHFHLSKPWFSFLAVLNFQRSWLSREIVFTVIYFLSVGYLMDLQWFVDKRHTLKTIIGWIAVLLGFTTVYCMARIYLMPAQVAWNSPFTILSFYGSTFILGVMSAAAILLIDLNFSEMRKLEDLPVRVQIVQRALVWLTAFAVLAFIFIVILNIFQIELLRAGDASAQTSLTLLLGIYQPLFILRAILLVAGVGSLAITVTRMIQIKKPLKELMTPVYVSCMLVMIGEILGRFLFYATHARIGI